MTSSPNPFSHDSSDPFWDNLEPENIPMLGTVFDFDSGSVSSSGSSPGYDDQVSSPSKTYGSPPPCKRENSLNELFLELPSISSQVDSPLTSPLMILDFHFNMKLQPPPVVPDLPKPSLPSIQTRLLANQLRRCTRKPSKFSPHTTPSNSPSNDEASLSSGSSTDKSCGRKNTYSKNPTKRKSPAEPMTEVKDKRERNKISASNYRKRRKTYFETLDSKLADCEVTIENQQGEIRDLQNTNRSLQSELSLLQQLMRQYGLQVPQQIQSMFSSSGSGSINSSRATIKQAGMTLLALTCLLLFSPCSTMPQAPPTTRSPVGRTLLSSNHAYFADHPAPRKSYWEPFDLESGAWNDVLDFSNFSFALPSSSWRNLSMETDMSSSLLCSGIVAHVINQTDAWTGSVPSSIFKWGLNSYCKPSVFSESLSGTQEQLSRQDSWTIKIPQPFDKSQELTNFFSSITI
jgi:hypothetical protein